MRPPPEMAMTGSQADSCARLLSPQTLTRQGRLAHLGRSGTRIVSPLILPFDAWLSNVRYRFLSPVSCHSAIGQPSHRRMADFRISSPEADRPESTQTGRRI
jgi:hypothetical protein